MTASVRRKTPTAARYLPRTMPVIGIGLVMRSWSVFWRMSSEMRRMVRMGTTIMKTKVMELNVVRDISYTKVLPAVSKQLREYSDTYASLKEAGVGGESLKKMIGELEEIFSGIEKAASGISVFLEKLEKTEDLEKKAEVLGDKGVEILSSLREYCDRAEELVDNNLWELPKYSEMLFLI